MGGGRDFKQKKKWDGITEGKGERERKKGGEKKWKQGVGEMGMENKRDKENMKGK